VASFSDGQIHLHGYRLTDQQRNFTTKQARSIYPPIMLKDSHKESCVCVSILRTTPPSSKAWKKMVIFVSTFVGKRVNAQSKQTKKKDLKKEVDSQRQKSRVDTDALHLHHNSAETTVILACHDFPVILGVRHPRHGILVTCVVILAMTRTRATICLVGTIRLRVRVGFISNSYVSHTFVMGDFVLCCGTQLRHAHSCERWGSTPTPVYAPTQPGALNRIRINK